MLRIAGFVFHFIAQASLARHEMQKPPLMWRLCGGESGFWTVLSNMLNISFLWELFSLSQSAKPPTRPRRPFHPMALTYQVKYYGFCPRFVSHFLETHPLSWLHFSNLGTRNSLPREIQNDMRRISFTPMSSWKSKLYSKNIIVKNRDPTSKLMMLCFISYSMMPIASIPFNENNSM